VVDKALRCLDRFLEDYPPDGGCDEGTSYWGRAGASLFDALDWLQLATNGVVTAWDEPLIAEIGRFIARAHIDGDYFINFADGGARVQIPAERVYSYGLRIGDAGLCGLGAYAYRRQCERRLAPGGPLARLLPALFMHEQLASAAAEPPYRPDVWLPQTEVMVARERGGTAEGLYLAAKGGHNAESHNHNDVGQFILYCDGQPAVIDLGVETYSAKTFSGRRYEIWTMRSSYHNLPDIDGCEQSPGREARADDVRYAANAAGVEFSLDLTNAYPQAESLRSWRRTLRLVRGAQPEVAVADDAEFTRPATIQLNLMCWGDCAELAPGRFALGPGGRVELLFDAGSLAADLEAIPIADGRLASAWGERVYRLRLAPNAPVTHGRWRFVFRKAR
ncbi:MAG TPA: heparinase II/III family protein, partial [Limnochordia bacterium]|nr:heparinase II/III family protein [Limnochordia bacterium]